MLGFYSNDPSGNFRAPTPICIFMLKLQVMAS